MKEQASNLRTLVAAQPENLNNRNSINKVSTMQPGVETRVIAITSGKGGVGKTNLAVNMAIALRKMGRQVLVFDADLGLANVEVLLGVNPHNTIYEVLYNGKSLAEVLVEGPGDIKFISGGSGLQELANLDIIQRTKLMYSLSYFQEIADFILIDTGAGISRNVLGFVAAAGEVIVVITPEPTSLTDAYGLIKILDKYKVHSEVHLVVNKAINKKEALLAAQRMEKVVRKFLDIRINHLGYICDDKVIGEAVKNQQPFTLLYPSSPASENVFSVARNILAFREANGGINSFLKKLISLFG